MIDYLEKGKPINEQRKLKVLVVAPRTLVAVHVTTRASLSVTSEMSSWFVWTTKRGSLITSTGCHDTVAGGKPSGAQFKATD